MKNVKKEYGLNALVELPPAPNGEMLTAFAEMPEGYPYRYILLTMDRQNFPGMPKPNWTYGAMYLYGANP